MTDARVAKDLVVLAADKDTEFSLRGLLARPQSLRIRSLTHDIFVHPEHDPGCRARAAQFLRSFTVLYRHALVVFDREGCGSDATRQAIELDVEESLARDWGGNSNIIVIDPELENWVWSDSPHVQSILGWRGRHPDLRAWLESGGLCPLNQPKPAKPKEAMRAALREVRKQPSASLFAQLAELVSVSRCTDPSFVKLTAVLRDWFPPN